MAKKGSGWFALSLLFLVALAACDDKPAAPTTPVPEATTPPKPLPPPPPPDPLADLAVDELGSFFKGERVDLSAKDAEPKLKAAIAKLDVQKKSVPLKVDRNTKGQDVGTVVNAFGEAGAVEIAVKTPGRDGSILTLKVVPETQLKMPVADCAVIAMLKKDSTSAVWHKKGGTATKLMKGLAGPDLSMTLDAVADQTKSCASPIWFIAGELNVQWGLVFDLGQRGLTATPPLRPTQIGMLREPPIAGRPVTLVTEKH
jgi:biopolymer transport protein ExbD